MAAFSCVYTPSLPPSLPGIHPSSELRRSGGSSSSSNRIINPEEALLTFFQEKENHRHEQRSFTYPFLLSSCGRIGALREGEQIHAILHKHGLRNDRHVHNALLFMYSSCKRFHYAANLFDKMPSRDVVSFTTIINGAADADRPLEAIQLFRRMLEEGVKPNEATLVCVLRAIADAGALGVGRNVHRLSESEGLESETKVVTALIDMYAKCGSIDEAVDLFRETSEDKKDVFMWAAAISGLACHGKSKEALEMFEEMKDREVVPDDRTITAALCACRASGWVAEGYRIYNNLHRYGKMRPKIQHYGCMVDLLARAGHLQEAEGFLRRMPFDPDAVMWRTLIWAANLKGEFNRAERLMEELKKMEEEGGDGTAGSYVLMSNVFAASGKWEEKARLREMMARRRVGKLPGCSRVELHGVVHEFVAGDSGHPEAEQIYRKSSEVEEKLRLEGFRPRLADVRIDVGDEERAAQLQHHSERLAVAYGLISTGPSERILVVKNLRSCTNCHEAMKLISKIYRREITIRDRIRFHHFKDGSCSCGDYW